MAENLPLVIFLVVVGIFLIRLVWFEGFRGALFGARVDANIGEVRISAATAGSTTLRIHRLEKREGRPDRIGVEVTQTTPLSWRRSGFVLTADEARRIVELLEKGLQRTPER